MSIRERSSQTGETTESAATFLRPLEVKPDYSTARTAVEVEADEAYKLQVLSIVHWSLGRRTESIFALAAFAWLDRAFQQRRGSLEHLNIEPFRRRLRGDPRSSPLMRKAKQLEQMQPMRRPMNLLAVSLLLGLAATAAAQDANIRQPVADLEQLLSADSLVISQAEISRPNAKGDITLRADVSFGGAPPLRVKLRRAEPGADSFNNVPRYDFAAYELQKLFLEPAEYVVPPTALRMVSLADFTKYAPGVARTFAAADQVLAVVQYWLSDIKVVADVYDPVRFAADPVYARHIGQLNVFTYLIRHRDSNLGNFLIGKAEVGARVFSIDHGVAFASDESDRGEAWKDMRVNQLPVDTVERLRLVTPQLLADRLGVLAQWQLEGRSYVPVAIGKNLYESRGVRRAGNELQMGLTRSEIREVHRLLTRLLDRVDRGEITLVPVVTATTTSP